MVILSRKVLAVAVIAAVAPWFGAQAAMAQADKPVGGDAWRFAPPPAPAPTASSEPVPVPAASMPVKNDVVSQTDTKPPVAEPSPPPAPVENHAPVPAASQAPAPAASVETKAPPPQAAAKPAPVRLAVGAGKGNEDARSCLELAVNTEIIKCAEKYRHKR